jgi:cobalt/nickel transport system permease protein
MLEALALSSALALSEPGNWPGVDESVVEKIAAEAGRKPRRPFIDTDRGDLLLFVFLTAGIAGGFALGYYYRVLFGERLGAAPAGPEVSDGPR